MGAIEIVQPGSPERAWGELLETDGLAGAKGICDQILASIPNYVLPLPELNGQVTVIGPRSNARKQRAEAMGDLFAATRSRRS